jgi:hypothetical protein
MHGTRQALLIIVVSQPARSRYRVNSRQRSLGTAERGECGSELSQFELDFTAARGRAGSVMPPYLLALFESE